MPAVDVNSDARGMIVMPPRLIASSLAGGEEEKVEEVNEGFGQSKKSASGWRQRASLSSIEGEAEPPWSQALSLPGVLRSASLSRLKSTQPVWRLPPG